MRLSYVGLAVNDVDAASGVFERHLGLPRRTLECAGGAVPIFPLGTSAIALFPLGHPTVEGETKPGVHHLAFEARDVPAATTFPRAEYAGVRMMLTGPLGLESNPEAPVERIDHIGVASTDVREDEAVFAGRLGFPVESRQTDMEVAMAVESFTSDKYGVVYHTRAPEPVGGLRVVFITVGDCELEFLANFDAHQAGQVDHGRAGTTRQDQGAIARFVASRGRGLHHVALKTRDIDRLLGGMAAAGLPMIDTKGRPGSRRARIGFPHPRAVGGVLMHFVERVEMREDA